MSNNITCWAGVNENGKFTPHSIFDYQDCIAAQEVTDRIDWSSAIANSCTAARGWNFMAKWIKRVCTSENDMILAEILRQSDEYDIGPMSVFVDTGLFNELIAAGLYYPINIVSPSESVSVEAYSVTSTECIGNGKYLHRLEPVQLAEADDTSMESVIDALEIFVNRPKLSTKAQSSITKNLIELEKVNLENPDDDEIGYRYDGDTAIEDSVDSAIVRLTDVLDNVCGNVARLTDEISDCEQMAECAEKQAKASIIVANGITTQLTATTERTQNNIDGIVDQIGTIVTEKNDFAAWTVRTVSRMKIAIAVLTIATLASFFI